MLTKIGDALGGWVPRNGAGDPLAVIRSAWLQLVGADVARAAQPVAIVNDTLVVLTASSAWSHQLAFLEPHIVREIRVLHAQSQVRRLRFRVGTIRAKSRFLAPAATERRKGAAAGTRRPAARDAAEALARFRIVVEHARRAHQVRGGTFCTTCAAPIAVGSHCQPCAHWARAGLEVRCQRLLFDAPWLRPQDVLDMLPGLDAATYDTIRRQLLRSWWDEITLARKRAALPRPIAPDRARLRKIASSYVLLETKLDPNRLEMDSPIRRNALGELYEFVRSVELGKSSARSTSKTEDRNG